MNRPLRNILLVLLLTGMLTACVTKPTPAARYYILTGPATLNQNQTGGPVLEIASLRLPQYLDRPQMVTRPTPQRLQIHDEHRWGDNLQKNIERVLASNLSLQTGSANVLVVPHLVPKVDYRLLLEIQQFERVQGDRVLLEAQWTLLKIGRKTPLAIHNVRLEEPLRGNAPMEDVVEAMSSLLSRLAQQIAAPIKG